MKARLLEINIPFCDVLKAQLYDLIKLNKSEHNYYVIEQILADKERPVLRLPLYYPDLNPNERIWADVKQWVASKNTTFKIKNVQHMRRQRFEEIGQEEWDNVCQHVDKPEQIYYEQEGIIEDAIERIIVEDNRVNSNGTDESSDMSESDDLRSGGIGRGPNSCEEDKIT
ncbi:hypothetical protein L798_15188 [Zootermopsis nevadensis]|uniref:Tc1-like transposase DDE domain-containing protein n=1 Tax=Zootermopsis nevadensis TaxID=136037 RepID=A0A067RH54_ZOONE|nr:hypothetical protein L798_15188 [Zootermopsis nevadensis]